MAGYGAGVRATWYDEGKNIDLEKERQMRLQQMQMTTDETAHRIDRQHQKEAYDDARREKALQLMKKQYREVATKSIDDAILESGVGKYDKLNAILTNSTDTNVNLDIKKGLEETLGGTIIKVRHPKPDDPIVYSDDKGDTSEKEIAPDQVAIDYITPSGEHLTKHMSALQLGAIVGTPHRVGVQKFTEYMDGSKIEEPTPAQLAKDISVSFDGRIEDLQNNLLVAATVGKDPNAKAMLDQISEVTAKDGDSLLKALTKQYASAKDPQEKKAILKRVEEVSKLMEKINKKRDPKKELEQKYLDAVESGETDKAKGYLDAYERLYGAKTKGTGIVGIKALQNRLAEAIANGEPKEVIEQLSNQIDTYNKATAKPTKLSADERKQQRIEDNQAKLDNLSVDDIVSGKVPTTELDKMLTTATFDVKSTDKKAVFMPLYYKLNTQDREGNQYLDLSNPALRTGEITPQGAKLLETYRAIETQAGGNPSSSSNKESINTISMGKSVLSNASNVTKQYDDLVAQGYFKGASTTGVVQAVNNGIFRKIGNLFDGTDEGATKTKSLINTQLSIGDRIDELEKLKAEGKLDRKGKRELEELRNKFQMNTRAKWDTQTYLVLKNMLKAISGQGVTNQELESFKKAFSGNDLDSLDAVIRQLNNSALQTMNSANMEYNKLVANGLPYTATKGILDMRSAGDYLLRKTKDYDVNTNLSFKPTLAIPFKQAKAYGDVVKGLTKRVNLSEAQVEDMMSEVYNYGISGSKVNFFQAHKIPRAMRPKYKDIFKAVVKLNHAYEASRKVGSTPPAQEEPRTEHYTAGDNEFKKMAQGFESGSAGYGLQNKTSSAYGKYQIINGKYEDIAKATGKSVEYLRTPKGQEEAMDYLINFYDEQLTKYGVPVTNINRYTVHQLGEARAERYFTGRLTNKDITLMWKNLGKPSSIQGDREAILKAWNKKFRKDT